MAKQSLHLRHATLLIVGALLIAAITATPTHAQQPPPVPHAFYGAVEVNGQPAAVGAQIEARGAGVKVGIQGNPLSATVAGRYGGPTLGEPKLGVQGYITDKTPIEFYVDGVKAECARPGGPWESSYPFASGVVTQLNLRVGQNATATATPTSTPLPMAASTSPTPAANSTPQPTWTAEPATPTTSVATQNAVRATRTPRSTTPTPVGATSAASVTPTAQDTPTALPSLTPIAAGNAAIVLASPTPTGSSVSKGGATPAQASPKPAAQNEMVATVPVSATPEPAKSEGAAAALADAAKPADTRTPAPLVARVTGAPRGTSAPILGSSAVADTVPPGVTAVASTRTLSSILPWAGAGLLLLAFGLVGIVVILRPGKSGRAGRNTEEQL